MRLGTLRVDADVADRDRDRIGHEGLDVAARGRCQKRDEVGPLLCVELETPLSCEGSKSQ